MQSIRQVLDTVGARLQHPRLEVPHAAWWTVEPEARTLRLEIPAHALDADLQETTAAAPGYLLTLVWWLRETGDADWRAHLRVTGRLPEGPTPAFRRAAWLLDTFASLFEWFQVDLAPALRWRMPADPVLNAEGGPHDVPPPHQNGLTEAELEYRLFAQPAELEDVNQHLPVAERLRRWPSGRLLQRQLPVGLFDGAVLAATEWCPAHPSAVNLWGASEDGRVVHVVELKGGVHTPLGVLPEALYFAMLAAEARDGGVRFDAPEGVGPRAIRAAERIVAWIVAPRLHPLLLCEQRGPLYGRTVLEAFTAALAPRRLELRFLPYRLRPETDPEARRFAWETARAWPKVSGRG